MHQREEMAKDLLRKPQGHAFGQQKLKDWGVRLGTRGWVALYYGMSIFFMIFGIVLLTESIRYEEWTYVYDGKDVDSASTCGITRGNEGLECTVTFTFDDDVSGPLYVYYGLTNFNQNNRRYTKSVLSDMMMGTSTSDIDTDDAELDCYPLIYNGTRMLYPCGLEAMTFFNDEIDLSTEGDTSDVTLDTDGITYTFEDEGTKYDQVDGFVYSEYTTGQTCDEVLGAEYADDCESYEDDNGTLYYYYYPDTDSFEYLHEVFDQINPIKGVTDENFIVWMRLAAFSTFRKYLGKIDTDVVAGESITFDVVNNFDVTSFSGSKSLIISTNHSNDTYVPTFWIVCFIMAALTFSSGTFLLFKLEPARWEELRSLMTR